MEIKSSLIKTLSQANRELTSKNISCVDLLSKVYENISKFEHINGYVSLSDKEKNQELAQ